MSESHKICRPTGDLVEQLADVQHEIWAHWMNYMFSLTQADDGNEDFVIPAEQVKRWKRLVNTPYADLTEKQKESDREQVHKFLHLCQVEHRG